MSNRLLKMADVAALKLDTHVQNVASMQAWPTLRLLAKHMKMVEQEKHVTPAWNLPDAAFARKATRNEAGSCRQPADHAGLSDSKAFCQALEGARAAEAPRGACARNWLWNAQQASEAGRYGCSKAGEAAAPCLGRAAGRKAEVMLVTTSGIHVCGPCIMHFVCLRSSAPMTFISLPGHSTHNEQTQQNADQLQIEFKGRSNKLSSKFFSTCEPYMHS